MTQESIAHLTALRDRLKIPAGDRAETFGRVAATHQLADVNAAWPGLMRAAGHDVPGKQRCWWERQRGGSKTSDSALLAISFLLFARRRVTAIAAAGDRDQAALLRASIAGIVAVNPALEYVPGGTRLALDVQRDRVIVPGTGSELQIISSDAATSFGLLPDAIFCDEICHWNDRSEALWHSLLSSAGKKPTCFMLTATNAGWKDTWPYRVRELVRTDPAWHFSRQEQPAPWISTATLAEQERLLPPTVFQRLWKNEWVSGRGDSLPPEQIERAIKLSAPMTGRAPGFAFVAGLDIGISNDHASLVTLAAHVGGTETVEREPKQRPRSTATAAMIELGYLTESPAEYEPAGPDIRPVLGNHKVRLADVKDWAPPAGGEIELAEVEDALWAAHERFGLQLCAYDPYQCEHLAQRLRRRGLRMEPLTFHPTNKADMAAAVMQNFVSSNVEMYDAGDAALLVEDLKRLRVVERQYGMALEFAKNAGHSDRAAAFAIAMLALRRWPPRVLRVLNDGAPLFLAAPEDFDVPPENQWFA